MRQKPLVLLVDDEDVFLEIAAMKLTAKANFEVAFAHSVPEAMLKAESLQPDFVLSDIYMPPGPTGWDLAIALRENPRTHDIKFAFFTSLRDPLIEVTGERRKIAEEIFNTTAVLSKTEDIDTLAHTVEQLVKI